MIYTNLFCHCIQGLSCHEIDDINVPVIRGLAVNLTVCDFHSLSIVFLCQNCLSLLVSGSIVGYNIVTLLICGCPTKGSRRLISIGSIIGNVCRIKYITGIVGKLDSCFINLSIGFSIMFLVAYGVAGTCLHVTVINFYYPGTIQIIICVIYYTGGTGFIAVSFFSLCNYPVCQGYAFILASILTSF